MRQLFFVSTFLFLSSLVFSQKKIFEFDLSDEKKIRPRIGIIPDEKRNLFYLTLANRKYIKRFVVNHTGSFKPLTEQKFSVDDDDDEFVVNKKVKRNLLYQYHKDKILNGYGNQRQIVEVLRDHFTDDFYFVQTDLQTGNTEITDTVFSNFKSDYLHSFVKDDRITVLTSPKKSNQFITYTKSPGHGVRADTLQFTGSASPAVKSDVIDIARNKTILLESEVWVPVGLLDFDHKAHISADKFLLSLNLEKGKICLVNFDMNQFTYSFQTITLPIQKDSIFSQATTFVDSLLLITYSTKNDIRFRFINSTTFQLVKEDTVTALDLTKLGIQIDKTNQSFKAEEALETSFQKLIKALHRNGLFIHSQRDRNNIHLTIGTNYNQVQHHLLQAVSFGTYQYDDGVEPSTISFDISYSGNLNRFKGEPKKMTWGKILMFIFAHRNYIGNSVIFQMKGYVYVGYHNYQTKKFVVHKFDDKLE